MEDVMDGNTSKKVDVSRNNKTRNNTISDSRVKKTVRKVSITRSRKVDLNDVSIINVKKRKLKKAQTLEQHIIEIKTSISQLLGKLAITVGELINYCKQEIKDKGKVTPYNLRHKNKRLNKIQRDLKSLDENMLNISETIYGFKEKKGLLEQLKQEVVAINYYAENITEMGKTVNSFREKLRRGESVKQVLESSKNAVGMLEGFKNACLEHQKTLIKSLHENTAKIEKIKKRKNRITKKYTALNKKIERFRNKRSKQVKNKT